MHQSTTVATFTLLSICSVRHSSGVPWLQVPYASCQLLPVVLIWSLYPGAHSGLYVWTGSLAQVKQTSSDVMEHMICIIMIDFSHILGSHRIAYDGPRHIPLHGLSAWTSVHNPTDVFPLLWSRNTCLVTNKESQDLLQWDMLPTTRNE